MIKTPVGWCAVLTSLEHSLKDHRLHDAADPDHSGCQGGAAGCDASERDAKALYQVALRNCTGTERRAVLATARH
jgi:hypothetical protein